MKMTKKGWWRRGGQWCQYKCLWYLHLYLYLSVYLYLCVYLYNLYGCVYFYISNSLLITMILSGVSINASGQIWQVSCYLHWPQSNHSVYYIAFANTTHCVLCSVFCVLCSVFFLCVFVCTLETVLRSLCLLYRFCKHYTLCSVFCVFFTQETVLTTAWPQYTEDAGHHCTSV